VKTHLAHIYAKLGVDSRAAAVSIALRRDGIR
jgi:DNA-binding CsgD family transcriptional regulator